MAAARSVLFLSSIFIPRISRNSLRHLKTDCSNSCKATSLSPREIISWMVNYAPIFQVQSDDISVITEPARFFETLKDNIRSAKHRIVLASLYLGTDHLERELVDSIHSSIKESLQSHNSSKLQVEILLEHTRGSRGKVNSRTMLLPLLHKFQDNVKVFLYHTPELRGLTKMLLPERFNETVALTHLKVYLTDDTIIMSGANLSHDYFTNRQDRYIEIRNSPEVADFFHKLVSTVSKISLQLQSDDTTKTDAIFNLHPAESNKAEFIKEASERLHALLEYYKSRAVEPRDEHSSTWVIPLLQLYPYGIRQDEMVTSKLLASLPHQSTLLLASGYFNLTRKYIGLLLGTRARCDILTAHPSANGFYQANGVAGGIPHAYTKIAKDFYREASSQHHRISVWEYARQAWTFHVKGLWYYPPRTSLPCLTLIGSPNFGYRSVYRDLEAQVAIVTEDEHLQQSLHKEQEHFFASADKVTKRTFEESDRKVPLWVFIVTNCIKRFF